MIKKQKQKKLAISTKAKIGYGLLALVGILSYIFIDERCLGSIPGESVCPTLAQDIAKNPGIILYYLFGLTIIVLAYVAYKYFNKFGKRSLHTVSYSFSPRSLLITLIAITAIMALLTFLGVL